MDSCYRGEPARAGLWRGGRGGPGEGRKRETHSADRNRPQGGRLRRHEEAPASPRPGRVQQDELLHRQGRAPRHYLRSLQDVRGRAQQEVQDRQRADLRLLHPGRPRRARRGPPGRARGHRGGLADGDSRAPGEVRLLEADGDERLRDRRLGSEFPCDRHRGRSFRQGDLRSEGIDLPRERREVERRPGQARQEAGEGAFRARQPRGRGPARDDQRRARPVRRRARLPGGVLVQSAAQAQASPGRRTSPERPDRLGACARTVLS